MTLYLSTLTLDEYQNLSLDDYNLLEIEPEQERLSMADVLTIDSGNVLVQNGNILINIGAPATYQELTTTDLYTFDIAEVSGKYTDRFDNVGYYVTGGL